MLGLLLALNLKELVPRAFVHDSIDTLRLTISKEIHDEIRRNKLPPPLGDTLLVFAYYLEGKLVGVLVVDDVLGKHKPITFAVAILPEGKVKFVEVIKYREPYGGEIRRRSFLKQFEGKTLKDPLKPNRDIRNIAGATISVRSITLGVRRALLIYERVIRRYLR